MKLAQAQIEFTKAMQNLQSAQAEADGEVAGRQDFQIGIMSRYSWFGATVDAPGYSKSYSVGYRRGWLAAERARSGR